jgi:hypothetical protein
MKVDGQINPNYVYIFALRPVDDPNPTDQGPIPVVAPPWGNGFVAGQCTYFVRWDPNASPRYTIYKFNDQLLTQFFAIGAPLNAVDVPSGGKQLQFEISLNQIADTAADAQAYQTLQVNFLTMDKVPQGSVGGSKAWDALGDGNNVSTINTWINVPVTRAGLFNNAFYNNLEPVGDVADPDLDISDFAVQVTPQ